MIDCPRNPVKPNDPTHDSAAPDPGTPQAEARGAAGSLGDGSDEFAHIPSPRPRPSWLSLVALLLSAYLVFHQRADLAYFLSPPEPLDLGEAARLFEHAGDGAAVALPVNRHVRVRGWPDFESSVTLDTQGDWRFRRLFLLQDTGARLLVQRVHDPLPVALAERDVFVGRLVRLDDAGFARSIREYFGRYVSATHFLDPGALHEAVAAARVPLALRDRAGRPVRVEGNELIYLTVPVPGRFQALVPQPIATDAAAARALLERAGVAVLPGAELVSGHPALHALEIVVPERDRAAVLSALADLSAGLQLHQRVAEHALRAGSLTARVGALAGVTADGQPVTLALADILHARLRTELTLPDDALLLIEGERPSSHRRVLVITVALILFGTFNLLRLALGLRRA